MSDTGSITTDPQIVALLERIIAGIDAVHAELRAAAAASASPLLTCRQLSSALQVDERTLRRLELLGEIPHAIKIGTAKRWRRADIDSYLAERRPA